jgi:hypothetical protein
MTKKENDDMTQTKIIEAMDKLKLICIDISIDLKKGTANETKKEI